MGNYFKTTRDIGTAAGNEVAAGGGCAEIYKMIKQKHLQLDQHKLDLARHILRVKTDNEAVRVALDRAIEPVRYAAFPLSGPDRAQLYSDEPVVLFTHIGKTAGSSVYSLIKENVSQDQIIGDGTERDFFYTLDKLWARQIRWVCGHFRLGLHEVVQIPGSSLRYITFLRDPVSREISFFFYRKNRNSAATGPPEDVDGAASAEEWFKSPLRPRNVQTWFLSGYGRHADINAALNNLLKSYFFFGITEYINESIDRMCAAFGFMNKSYPKVNVSNRPEVDQSTYARLDDILRCEDPLDFQLYRAACDAFQSRLSRAEQV